MGSRGSAPAAIRVTLRGSPFFKIASASAAGNTPLGGRFTVAPSGPMGSALATTGAGVATAGEAEIDGAAAAG